MEISEIMAAWRRGEIHPAQARSMLDKVDDHLTTLDDPFSPLWIELVLAQLELEQTDINPVADSVYFGWSVLDMAA